MAEAKADQGSSPSAVGTSKAELKGNYDVDEHHLSPQEVAARYSVDINFEKVATSKGLASAQVKELQKKWGLNQLTPPKEVPEVVKFLRQFINPLMLLLLIAGGLLFMAYGVAKERDKNNLILGAALVIVVSLTCVMSYFQERSAGNVLASLKKLIPNKCTVLRDGVEQKVDATELVPGDLVRLYIGDRVPADVRIIETSDLKVECSSLTGEADLVPATVDKKHDLPAEARNLVFMSSLAMNGEGRGIVIRTGDNTMIGKIAGLATDTGTHRSTLQQEVHRLIKFVAVIAFTTGIILFVVGLIRKVDPVEAFVNGFILVVVANVPEGLPATVTSCLALTAARLRDRQVLIKRTDIIENLGCATIIASDKTGTLTQNVMTVENLWCNCELHKGSTFQPPPAVTPEILARQSLARASAALARASQNAGKSAALARASRQAAALSRSSASISRVSMDPATSMTIGRSAVPRGDGYMDGYMDTRTHATVTPIGESKLWTDSLHTFSVQSFAELNAVSWARSSALTKLLAIASVCNKAKFTYDTAAQGAQSSEGAKPAHVAVPMFQHHDERKVLGDATDAGLLRYCDRLAPVALVRMAYRSLFDIPFNSANKWSLVVTECPGNINQHVVMMKGAPEIVLGKCTHYFHNKEEKPIDDEFRANMTAAYERCGFMGERVLGFCYKIVPSCNPEAYKTEEGAPPTSGLVFMGLISLVDPPRPGVMEAVGKCRSAGVSVAMVTGDHPLTAEAIARKVGIITLPTRREIAAEQGVPESSISLEDERVGAVVVTGAMIRELKSEEEWDEILMKPEIVFARTSPQQKLQIVENLQRLGEIVAVTGDGVNDSPALKKAQIGVSMGKGGSDVARDAADIVLLDDDFTSIVNAIEEGRVIYDNLKKTIAYTLTHAVPEVWPMFLNLVLSFPNALSGLLILSIDLLTEQGPAISLAYEKAEADVMSRPPRDIQKDRLISGTVLRYSYLIAGIWEAWICMVAYFSVFLWYDIPISMVFDSSDTYWKDGAPPLMVGGRELQGREQRDIYWQAQSAYYVTLICCQFWHIWICKTRTVSIFKHGLFKNPITIFGTVISVATMIIVVYVPWLHDIFFTANLHGIGWLPQLIFPLTMWPYSEYSKYLTRRDPNGWWATYMQW